MSITLLAEAGPGMLPDIFEEAYHVASLTNCPVKFPAVSTAAPNWRDFWTVYAAVPSMDGETGIASRFKYDDGAPALFVRTVDGWIDRTADRKATP